MDYRTLDPSTGELVASYPLARADEIEAALARASATFADWRGRSFAERGSLLGRVADGLEREAGSLAVLMAQEMGKPLREGEAEARKCAWACRFFAERAEEFLAPQERESDGSRAQVVHEPLGPLVAILPWNFPFWQFFRFAAPAVVAGNVALLKHAPNTPGSALAIERLFLESGLPPGVVQNLFLNEAQAATVIEDARVRGVTLTGSTRAGREVGAAAGRALKPLVLELGGSDPFIVLEDADLERAAETGVASRLINCGQSCIAAKRFLVEASIFDAFAELFVAGMRARTQGDPRDPGIDLGPLARSDLRERLAKQVDGTVAAGATCLTGGAWPARRGFFYPPTVLTHVPPGSPGAREELFGPVATLGSFAGEEQALALANASAYGLAASIWTRDEARAANVARRLECGAVFVNGLSKSDPRLPFGGVKESGFGRELGREGLFSFVNVKSVWWA